MSAPPASNKMTIDEFAAYWNVCRRSVFKLIERGLPSVKGIGVGRRILVREADAWLAAGGASKKVRKSAKRASEVKKKLNDLSILEKQRASDIDQICGTDQDKSGEVRT